MRFIATALLFIPAATLYAEEPHPVTNPESPLMLAGAWVPEDTDQIDFDSLPRVAVEHAVVSDVREEKGVNQHNYLTHYRGKFFAMWSDGPGVEDRVGQRIKFATSADGLTWDSPRLLSPEPPGSGPGSPHYGTRSAEGFRYIARGFWQRDGELLALASLDEAAGFFGPGLELRAFRWTEDESWEDAGLVFDDTINNFPPLQLVTGDWMMSRRPHDYKTAGVHFLVGGVKSIGDWKSYPVLGSASELIAEEPDWWILPGDHLSAVFRDNRKGGFLFRAFSTDHGRSWSKPVRTNFPDATSKISGLRLADGRYVLVSNPNPKKRDPLTLSISEDGLVFTKMLYLVGGRHVDYPHVIEHGDSLFIAFAGGKQSVEVVKVQLADVDATAMPDRSLRNESTEAVSGSIFLDLSKETETLYLGADLTVPPRGQSTSLSLATGPGEKRVSIGIDNAGRLTAYLYEHETAGETLEVGERLSLLARVVSHAGEPDEFFLKTGPAGAIPAEPSSEEAWTVVNRLGKSRAKLSRVILNGDKDSPAFTGVRIASSYAALTTAESVAVTVASPAPPSAPPFDLSPPHPVENPGSQLLLAGPGIPQDTHRIAFSQLPTVPSEHAVVSDALPEGGDRVNQHNYLVHHAGRFWAMWSDGPGESKGPGRVPGHDLAGQHVSFATSPDGLNWSPIANLSGPPEKGYGWIARGFWLREGKLLALASRFVGPVGYRGEGLQLHAFSLEDATAESPVWRHHGLVMDDALNNFEPRRLPSGEWMMSRRDHVGDVHVAVGGVASFDDWTSFPQAAGQEPTLSAEEPDWWVLPDGNLCALFRDNNKSGYLYRAFSADHGRTWSTPVKTNFPDARSKFCALRLQDGRYALVSNSNPRMRNPLTLALSDDGLVFDKLFYLVGGRHVDYPHLIEHDGALYIAFNTLKMTCEVLKVRLEDLAK